jgi:hypothetical protein
MTQEKAEILRIIGAVLTIGVVLANTQSIYGLLSAVLPINSTGIVASANINVYSDSGGLNEVSLINWGTLNPGGFGVVTIYVKNTGEVPLTLEMTNDNWDPESGETFFTLTWDYTGGEVQPGGLAPVTLTLTVSGLIQGITNFSFDVVVIGTEA